MTYKQTIKALLFGLFLICFLGINQKVEAVVPPPPNANIINVRDGFNPVGTSKFYNNWSNTVEVTSKAQNQYGAIWYNEPLNFNKDFQGDFAIYLGDSYQNAADGMTFTMQSQGKGALGGDGSALGAYGMQKGTKITNPISPAISIEFDTYHGPGDRNVSENYGYGHIAAVIPPIAAEVKDGQTYKHSNIMLPTDYLSNDKWLNMSYSWSNSTQTFSYKITGDVIKSSEESHIIKFNSSETFTYLRNTTAQKYFGNNGERVYWGFTGSTGDLFSQQIVAIGNNPVEFQNPVSIHTSVKRDGVALSGAKVILESASGEDVEDRVWRRFDPEPEGTLGAVPEFVTDSKGDIKIIPGSPVVSLLQRYGGTKGNEYFRFRLVEASDSKNRYLPAPPEYGLYQGGDPDAGLENFVTEEFVFSGNTFGLQEIRGIQQYPNEWGSSPWYIDNKKVLHLGRGELAIYEKSDGTVDHRKMKSPFIYGINRQEVTSIQFDEIVKTPVNSDSLFRYFDELNDFRSFDKIDTSHTQNMNNMFADNQSIEELELPFSFNTLSVDSMDSMFANNKNLTYLDISPVSTRQDPTMKGMFTGDDSLSMLELGSKFSFSGPEVDLVKRDNGWSSDDNAITFKTTNDFITQYKGSQAGLYVWNGIVKVEYVDEKGKELAPPETFRGALGTNYKTSEKSIPGYSLTVQPARASGRYTANDQTVTYVYAENRLWGDVPWHFDEKVGVLNLEGNDAGDLILGEFKDAPWHKNLLNRISPKDIKTINLTGKMQAPENSKWLFSNDGVDYLSQLEKIEGLPYLDTSNVINMEQMFKGLQRVNALDLSGMSTKKVEQMGGMFTSDVALKELTFSNEFNFVTGTSGNVGLPNVPNDEEYSGKWERLDGVSYWVGSAEEFMQQPPVSMAGTFKWQGGNWLPSYTKKWKNSATDIIPKENAFVMMYSSQTEVVDYSDTMVDFAGRPLVIGPDDSKVYFDPALGSDHWIKISNVGYYQGKQISVRVVVETDNDLPYEGYTGRDFIGIKGDDFLSVGVSSKNNGMTVTYEFLDDQDNLIELDGYWSFENIYLAQLIYINNDDILQVYSNSRLGDTPNLIRFKEEKDWLAIYGIKQSVFGTEAIQKSMTMTYAKQDKLTFRAEKTPETGPYSGLIIRNQQSTFARVGIPDPQGINQEISQVDEANYDHLGVEFIQHIPYEIEQNRDQKMTWDMSVDGFKGMNDSGFEVIDETGADRSELFEFDKDTQQVKPVKLNDNQLYNHYFTFRRKVVPSENVKEADLVDKNNGKYIDLAGSVVFKVDDFPPVTSDMSSSINLAANITYDYIDGMTQESIAKSVESTSLLGKKLPLTQYPDIQGYIFNRTDPADLTNQRIKYTDTKVQFIYDKVNKVWMTVNYYRLDREGKETSIPVFEDLKEGIEAVSLRKEVTVGQVISDEAGKKNFDYYDYNGVNVINDVTQDKITDDIVPSSDFTVNYYYRPLEDLDIPNTISFGNTNAQTVKAEYPVKNKANPVVLTSGFSSVNWVLEASSDGLFSTESHVRLLSDMYFKIGDEKVVLSKEGSLLVNNVTQNYYELPLVSEDNKEGLFLRVGASGIKESSYEGTIKFSAVTGP